MEKKNITPGPWRVGNGKVWSPKNIEIVTSYWSWHPLADVTKINETPNLELIAEAGTVFHESGLTPRELLNVLSLDNAWPLQSVLKELIKASKILLRVKSYDGQRYEEIEIATKRAKEILDMITKSETK